MATPDDYEADAQDTAEVYDETNLTEDGVDIANFDDLVDVFDATTAQGDARDIEAMDEADFDEEAIDDEDLGEDEDSDDTVRDALESEDDDEDDDLRDADSDYEAARDLVEEGHDASDAPVSFAADVDAVTNADDEDAQAYESEGPLSDEELKTLGYENERKDDKADVIDKSSAIPGSGKTHEDVNDEASPRQEDLLDEGLEETFPASDPVSVKAYYLDVTWLQRIHWL